MTYCALVQLVADTCAAHGCYLILDLHASPERPHDVDDPLVNLGAAEAAANHPVPDDLRRRRAEAGSRRRTVEPPQRPEGEANVPHFGCGPAVLGVKALGEIVVG